MSTWLLPALVLVAARAVTCLCCLRPMGSGACHRDRTGAPAAREDLERQLRQARAERDRPHAQKSTRGRSAGRPPALSVASRTSSIPSTARGTQR